MRTGRRSPPRRRSRWHARAAAASSSRARARSYARRPCRRPRPRARRRAPSRPRRRGTGAAADPAPERVRTGPRASASGVTQAPIEVANDLPRKGPSGWYSHAWMSRALQSLTSTTPKTWSRKAEAGTGSPSVLPTPTTKPSSSSMSSLRLGPKRGASSEGDFDWPHGRTIGVPLTTTVPARPWYPTGRWRQFGKSGSESGRKSRPRLVACSSDE